MSRLRFLVPRIEYILLIAVFWGITASGPRILNFDGDLPRHILSGNLILQTGHVSTTDIFSFRTTGYPSFPHEWLAQVLLAAAYNVLGLDGIVLLTALVVTLTWGLVYRQAMRRSNSLFSALSLTALGVAAAQIHVLPRPHVFTYLLAAIWITVLENLEENKRQAGWALPLIMLIWVNTHGMFVLGIFILGIYLVGDFLSQPSKAWFTSPRTRFLLIVSGLSILATFVSPTGPGIWETIASLGSNAYITSKIPEYRSANFHLPETWPFLILLGLALMSFARSREKIGWKDLLLMAAFTGLALYSSRMIPIFAIIGVPITARAVAGWLRSEAPQSRVWSLEANISRTNAAASGLVWVAAVMVGALLLLRSGYAIDPGGAGNAFDRRFFPVEAAGWLKAHPQSGHMFNEFDWGGYLLLSLWPEQQIFMDGHTHIYGERLTREYEQVITLSEGWQNVFTKYNIHWVIMRRQAPLVQALIALDTWEIAYEDTTTTILVHR